MVKKEKGKAERLKEERSNTTQENREDRTQSHQNEQETQSQ